MTNLQDTWIYLSTSPLFHLTLTLVAFQCAKWVFEKSGYFPLLNPVLMSILLIVGVLILTDTDYATYFQGAQFVHFLLGPATVALAVPLYQQWKHIRRSAVAIVLSVLIGSLTAIISAVGVAYAMGAAPEVLASLAPKSTTAPVAMAISSELGGVPSITAVVVIFTGIIGAMFGPALLMFFRVYDERSAGLAIGTASHGIGTARAVQLSDAAGAFSGLAMGLNAVATALLLPLLWALLSKFILF